MNGHFVQDNISKSSYGVLRGLHFRKENMHRQNWYPVLKEKFGMLL
jgi:dTDP-4-dehydrorhamnose 3,5-epimerase-like enzyme